MNPFDLEQIMPHVDESKYYDAYSSQYDLIRGNAYHDMISDLTQHLIYRFVPKGGKVLDLGCGTGINMDWLKSCLTSVVGLDLSYEMLKRARMKGHTGIRGTAIQLPFRSEVFDLVYSFKVLPHVREIDLALAEVTRVLKPDGIAILESYNRYSLRGLLKMILRPRRKIAPNLTEQDIHTRFDSPRTIFRKLKGKYTLITSRGLVIFMPVAKAYEIPVLNQALSWLERYCCDTFLKYAGGFFIVVGRKN